MVTKPITKILLKKGDIVKIKEYNLIGKTVNFGNYLVTIEITNKPSLSVESYHIALITNINGIDCSDYKKFKLMTK